MNKNGIWICVVLLSLSAHSAEKQDYSQWGVNVQHISPGVYTAGVLDPDRTTEIAASGVDAVFNLRFPKESKYEEGPLIEQAGMHYENFPIGGGVPAPDTVARFSRLVSQYENKQVLIHCASGNRVGILWAAHLLDQGLALDEALEQVKSVATRSSSVAAIREYAKKHHAIK